MALRDVNLVPQSIIQRRYAKRHLVGWAVAYGLLIVLLAGGHLLYTRSVIAKRRHAAGEEEMRRRLAGAIAEIEDKKEELARLAFVREIVCPVSAAEVLGRLAEAMAPQTWLTQLSLTGASGEDMILSMEGTAFSNSSLGAMVRGLSESDSFRDVILGGSSERTVTKSGSNVPETVVQFRVKARAVSESRRAR